MISTASKGFAIVIKWVFPPQGQLGTLKYACAGVSAWQFLLCHDQQTRSQGASKSHKLFAFFCQYSAAEPVS